MIGGGRNPQLGAARRFRALNINDKKETQDMLNENKKKVALGTTLALLLGAGSYCLLGIGGGSDSEGLNSVAAGPKVARVKHAAEPITHGGKSRPKYAENRFKKGKKIRDPHSTNSNGKKTNRPKGKRSVTKKKPTLPPAA